MAIIPLKDNTVPEEFTGKTVVVQYCTPDDIINLSCSTMRHMPNGAKLIASTHSFLTDVYTWRAGVVRCWLCPNLLSWNSPPGCVVLIFEAELTSVALFTGICHQCMTTGFHTHDNPGIHDLRKRMKKIKAKVKLGNIQLFASPFVTFIPMEAQ